MRAFVHTVGPDGRDMLGSTNGRVTPEYVNLTMMRQHFLDKLPPGSYHIEAFHDFENKKFGNPDVDFYYDVVPPGFELPPIFTAAPAC